MIGLTDNYNYKYSFKMYICFWFDEISRPIILPIKKGKWSRKTLIIIFISQTFRVTQKIERNVENCRQQDNID